MIKNTYIVIAAITLILIINIIGYIITPPRVSLLFNIISSFYIGWLLANII